MSKTLFLFLFSDRPDGYINAIAHTFDHKQVEAVKLVYVKGAKTGLSDQEASIAYNRIWTRLINLADEPFDSDIYKRINERLLNRHLVPLKYTTLKDDLSQLIKQHGGTKNCIIDLTGASKVPSIDVFSVCLALGIKSVHIFELADRPDPKKPNDSLYHSLDETGYSYTCLTDTEPVIASQSSLLRKTPLLWAVGLMALIVMIISLILLATTGPNSPILQTINIAAAVVGLTTPILALIQERKT